MEGENYVMMKGLYKSTCYAQVYVAAGHRSWANLTFILASVWSLEEDYNSNIVRIILDNKGIIPELKDNVIGK